MIKRTRFVLQTVFSYNYLKNVVEVINYLSRCISINITKLTRRVLTDQELCITPAEAPSR